MPASKRLVGGAALVVELSQPSRVSLGKGIGACACSVCGWRAWKAWAMLSGWQARDAGRHVLCSWCRARGVKIDELEEVRG